MGPAVVKTARALGMRCPCGCGPLMPHQQYIADVGGEVDDRGLFVYGLVIVTLQRQGGKTAVKQAQSVQRALQGPNRRCWDTAQTGQDARDKHRELADVVMSSPLRDLVAHRRQAAGSEGLTFVNGSTLRPHPPTRDALHGKQGDHNDIDEGWAFDVPHGDDLLQAIDPTHATRPGAQTWVWSTRGDRLSEWFHGLIEQGYAGLPGVALFDFGIPDDADPTDLDVIRRHHPAYGHTIGDDALIAAQSVLKPGDYARAYGNRATGSGEWVIPLEPWNAARVTADLPFGRPAYGAAVSGDGAHGSLVAAVIGADGVPVVEVIERRPGRSWLVDRILQLNDRGVGVAIDRYGPAGPVAAELELRTTYTDTIGHGRYTDAVELLKMTTADTTAACQDLYDRIIDPAGPRLRHRAHEALDAAVDTAERKYFATGGGGGWLWQRNPHSDPLEAATLAAWAVARNPAPAEAPFTMFA